MEISIAGAALTFAWRGPSLTPAFAVGDAVQVVTQYLLTGLSSARMSIVRSPSATAVTVDGAPSIALSTLAGSSQALSTNPDFPELSYGLVSCCTEGTFGAQVRATCDYAALQASFGGNSSMIALQQTGAVGPWSITNLESSYHLYEESTWHIKVTLLGPATAPPGLDGGL
jgi:hypothetical protein